MKICLFMQLTVPYIHRHLVNGKHLLLINPFSSFTVLIMSYLRPLSLQPGSLKQAALDAWLQHLLHLIRDSQIISRGKPVLSPSIQSLEDCLKVLVSYQNKESSRNCDGNGSQDNVYR